MSLSNVSLQCPISSPLTLPLDSCCRTIACFFCSNVWKYISAICIIRSLHCSFYRKLSVCSFQGTSSTSVLPHLLGPSKSTKRFFKEPGSHLLSHAVSSIVPSASWVLTIVFGMGTGVSPRRIATGKFVTNLLITKQYNQFPYLFLFLRKEVIQPHLPIRLPCYDFTPVTSPAFGSSLLSVESLTSGITDSHGVTGGVYKTRERIHRSILICDY